MSNRRRPQRRDAHGAPVRTRQEIWMAVLTASAVFAVTTILVVVFRHQPASTATPVGTSTASAPKGGSTTTTVPALKPSGSSTTSSSTVPSSTTTSHSATPSTTKP